MRPRRWFRLIALIAAIGLFFAACSTEDDEPESTGDTTEDGGTDSGTADEPADGEPATCQGEAGADPSTEAVGGGEGDGADFRVGMVLDIGGVDDDSFNEAANTGLQAAAEDFGVEVQFLEPNEDGSNRADLLRQLATDDYDLVIGVGFLFAEAMGPLADEFPDVNFAIIDDASLTQSNVTPLVFAEEQGSFLVGAAAALASGTGNIGFIGGVETELIQKFQAGFEAGVAEINPDATVDVQLHHRSRRTSTASPTRPRPAPSPTTCTTTTSTSCTTQPVARVAACSSRPSRPTASPSASTPTSTSRSRPTPSRASSPRC